MHVLDGGRYVVTFLSRSDVRKMLVNILSVFFYLDIKWGSRRN
jgi:hypothetical protein